MRFYNIRRYTRQDFSEFKILLSLSRVARFYFVNYIEIQ